MDHPELFRFGASSLLNDVLLQLRKQTHRDLPGRRTSSRSTDGRRREAEGQGAGLRNGWEYAPSLEARDIVSFRSATASSSAASGSRPRSRTWFTTVSPATEEPLAEVAQADAKDVALASTPPVRRSRPWSALAPRRAREVLFRIARVLQERAREFAVAESMDGGKPIKESRDFDVPMAAAHFFYHAGWADKLEYAFPGGDRRPLGVAGQIIPVELPAAHARVEDRAGARVGNTVVLKPAETTPLTALLLRGDLRQAELPPGVVNIVTGAGETGARLVRTPQRRQGRVHRLDRSRQAIQRAARGPDKGSRSSSAAKRRTSCSTTRRSTRRSKAS